MKRYCTIPLMLVLLLALLAAPPQPAAGLMRTATDISVNAEGDPVSLLGVAHSVKTIAFQSPGVYLVTYAVHIKNMGTTQLYQIRASSLLGTTFNKALSFEVIAIRGTDLTPNTEFNGTSRTTLLTGQDQLFPEQIGTVEFDVLVQVNRMTFYGTSSVTATASTTSGGPSLISDTSTDGTEPDPDGDVNPNNNSVPTPLAIDEPLLSAAMFDFFPIGDHVKPGDEIEYTMAIENNGVGDAKDVMFSLAPDPHATLLPDTLETTRGTILAGNTVGATQIFVDIGKIAASTKVRISFKVRVKEGVLPVGTHTISNQGLIWGGNFAQLATDDPDTQTGSDTTQTPVFITALPLRATMVDTPLGSSPATVHSGELIRYTVTVTNQGIEPAQAVVFTNTPDANTELVFDDVNRIQVDKGRIISGQNPGDTEVRVEFGDMAPGDQATIIFAVRVKDVFPEGTHPVFNQGQVSSSNFLTSVTDNPITSTPDDATRTDVAVTAPDSLLFLPLLRR